jgi:group I intron endonuclease
MKRKGGVYRIKNIITDDFYIGQSVDLKRRKRRHFFEFRSNKHHNLHMQRAFNKYGEDNFKFEILLYCEPFELTWYEQGLVNRLNPSYNIFIECINTFKGIGLTEEHKRKISETHKGIKHTEETKKKISDFKKGIPSTFLGKHFSEESKKKISKANTGKIRSEKTKQQISKSLKGRMFSKEHISKLTIANRNKALSKEENKKLSYSRQGKKSIENSSSIYVGVYFDKNKNKWLSNITCDKKQFYLGSFKYELEAALAYNEAALELFGYKAKLNNISQSEIDNLWNLEI